MHAFIVRPFNVKSGVDFESVDAKLIQPALKRVGVTGSTTQEIARAGNIREDMFEQLITADIVIADISIHNANVFYELGIRHALRDKFTVLIRSRKDETPFDLKTDRYLSYDQDNPDKAVDELVRVLTETRNLGSKDSPVYKLLPALSPPETDTLQIVPATFREEVAIAREKRQGPGDLAFLATELQVIGVPWLRQGLALVAEALYGLESWRQAAAHFEKLREFDHRGYRANARLATIYQKLGELDASQQAIERIELGADSSRERRAEVCALTGSTAKRRWLNEWRGVPAAEREVTALASAELSRAIEAYGAGFEEDLNHYYSGLNAFGLMTVLVALAERQPKTWSALFKSDSDALSKLKDYRERLDRIGAALCLGFEAGERAARRVEHDSAWLEISVAHFACLTSSNSQRVAMRYRRVIGGLTARQRSSEIEQLAIYRDLAVCVEGAKVAIAEIDRVRSPEEWRPARVVLFTGHRFDGLGRSPPRFPQSKKEAARARIVAKLESEVMDVGADAILGIAGGASGGDTLFHEVCRDLGIRSEMYLALPRDAYVAKSVQDAGPEAVAKFDQLRAQVAEVRVLGHPDAPWLTGAMSYTVWERNNLWTLHNALAHGADKVTVLALWNGEEGDGPGGTKHMVDTARKSGARIEILDPSDL